MKLTDLAPLTVTASRPAEGGDWSTILWTPTDSWWVGDTPELERYADELLVPDDHPIFRAI